jgi:peroxiredoxin
MTMVSLKTCVAVAAFAFLAGCELPEPSLKAAVKDAKTRKAAPEFALTDSNGKQVKLSDYKGKVVLLNFWATWCGPCKIEIPWFKEFETTYKNKGFAVLGVAMDDEGWETVKPYIQQKQVNYRVLAGTEQVSMLYGDVESLPTTFVIDRNGKIASVHIGLVSKSDYSDEILQLLH